MCQLQTFFNWDIYYNLSKDVYYNLEYKPHLSVFMGSHCARLHKDILNTQTFKGKYLPKILGTDTPRFNNSTFGIYPKEIKSI